MKNKKRILSLIILSISLVAGLFLMLSQSSKNKLQAQEISSGRAIKDNIFQSVTMKTTGRVVVLGQEDSLKNDTEVDVEMGFKFTNKDYKVGDVFTTTLPTGFTYVQVEEGDLSSAKYKIDPATGQLTITITQDVQSAEYKIKLTTRIKFDESANSKQTMLFETVTPTNYILHLYSRKDASQSAYGKLFDSAGESMEGKSTLSPASVSDFDALDVNFARMNLAENPLKARFQKTTKPSNWADGYVKIKTDINDYKFMTYETAIDGTQIGEKKELKMGQDFTVSETDEGGSTLVTFQFKERFHEAFEVSKVKLAFDYSEFNPISNGYSNNITLYVTFSVSKESTRESAISYFNTYFTVNTLGYLNIGKITKDGQIKENENIVKMPIYINGTKKGIKKNDTFTLINKEGNPAVLSIQAAIDGNFATQYEVTVKDDASTVEGKKSSIDSKLWKISNDNFGNVTLTYLGEDTIDTVFGLDLYIGMIDTEASFYNNSFILSGNGYQTSGETKNLANTNVNMKKGTYSDDRSLITWESTLNGIYQKITEVSDTYGYGVALDSMKNLKITTVNFGKFGASKELVEGTDYKLVKSPTGFKVNFTKEINEKVTISYETGVDLKTVDWYYARAKNTITPTLEYASSPVKSIEYPTEGFAYIPTYLQTNAPILLGKNKVNTRTELVNSQPVNQGRLLINPAGIELNNNEVVVKYKSLNVSVLNKKFTVNKVSKFSTTNYDNLVPDTGANGEITSSSEDYPEIIIEKDQLRIKNKKLSQPIIISFTLAKNNYYDIGSDYVPMDQTNDEGLTVTDNARMPFYFDNYLPKTFTIKRNATPKYAEAELTIGKTNGEALIPKTVIGLTNFSANDAIFIESQMTVTDSEGNELPNDVISIGRRNTDFVLTINSDQLKNGLIVKGLMWRFTSSGTKTWSDIGDTMPFTNSKNNTSNQNYLKSTYNKGTIDIDNSGTGGAGDLVLTNVAITTVDDVTGKPVVGAMYEIIKNNNGKSMGIITSNANGQIALKDIEVTDYTFKEIKAPDGYISNDEYNGDGKSFTLNPTETNAFTIRYVKEGKVNVHFTYEDGTAIETAAPITVKGGNGSTINLKEQEEVKTQLDLLSSESLDYRFINFDQGKATGSEEALVVPYDSVDVYYKYEGLLTLTVPDLLQFETGFVSPFEQVLAYANADEFKVALRDSRQITTSATTKVGKTRGNIRLNAFLSKEFTTQNDKVLRNARLIYQNGSQNVVLNGTGGELVNNKQDKNDAANKDFSFILDSASNNQGFKLEVPAKGTLADEYTGVVTWEIIQEP